MPFEGDTVACSWSFVDSSNLGIVTSPFEARLSWKNAWRVVAGERLSGPWKEIGKSINLQAKICPFLDREKRKVSNSVDEFGEGAGFEKKCSIGRSEEIKKRNTAVVSNCVVTKQRRMFLGGLARDRSL